MSLAPEWRLGALSLVDAPFLVAFGADHGSPESSADVLASFLTDGDIEVGGHAGNRTVVIPILLEGSDLLELAEAEAALIVESVKAQNTLYVDPGDGFAPPFQMTVFGGPGSVVWNRDDVYEQQGYRSFTLTLRALPYVYSATETITPALAASGTTTTTVADGSSATGWSGTISGTSAVPTVSAGAVTITTPLPTDSGEVFQLTYTASIATSTTKYLMVDWRVQGGEILLTGPSADVNGTALPLVSSTTSPTAGYTRSWFQVGAAVSSVASVTFSAPTTSAIANVRSFAIDNLARTDVRPTLGSAKQQIRTLAVGGTAPTVGSLAIEHSTTSLGDVLLYTCPEDGSGYVPALVGYRTTSATPDAACVSGGSVSLDGASATYSVPSDSLPNGEYVIIARLRSTTGSAQAFTLRFGYTVSIGGTIVVPGGYMNYDQTVTAPASYGFVRLKPGMLHLPYMYTQPGAASTHFFVVSGASGTSGILLDEIYLANLTTGDLTQLECGTATASVGGSSRRAWVDSPSVDNEGLGNLVRGHSADRSDAFSAYPVAVTPGIHEFPPGIVKVLSVATNPTTAADVSFRHRAAWTHTAAS